MPIAVRITPTKMSRDDYERVMEELRASGCGEPEGRLYHASYGEDEVHVFETWESEQHFQPYHDNLVGILQGAGIDSGLVQIEPVHSHYGG